MAISPRPTSSSLDASTATPAPVPLAPPRSPLPFFLTLSLLLIPYFFLSLHLGLDPRNLPPPLPSLFLVLSTFTILHLCLPHIIVFYAPPTPKGRYGAQWTAPNLNVVASSTLWLLVIATQPTWNDAAFGLSVGGAVLLFTAINVGEFCSIFRRLQSGRKGGGGGLKGKLTLSRFRWRQCSTSPTRIHGTRRISREPS